MGTFSIFTCVNPGFGGVICGQDPHESNGFLRFSGSEEGSWLWGLET